MSQANINQIRSGFGRVCSDKGWSKILPDQHEQVGLMDDKVYEYIDNHLLVPSKMSHMIFLLYPYNCNRMEAVLSAISDGM